MRIESKSISDKRLLWQWKAFILTVVLCISFNTVEQCMVDLDAIVIEMAKDSKGENEPSKLDLNIELESDDYFHPNWSTGLYICNLNLQTRLQKINPHLEQFLEIHTPPPEHAV